MSNNWERNDDTMLEAQGEKQGELLEITTEGTATQEDLATFKEALKTKTLQEEPVNILFIFKNIEGITPKALVEDIKTFPDVKSIGKAAIASDGTLTELHTTIGNLIPGIEVEHFPMTDLERARKWLLNK